MAPAQDQDDDPGRDAAARPVEDTRAVSAHQSAPDRTVFTEADNPDGWLSTDHTVEVDR